MSSSAKWTILRYTGLSLFAIPWIIVPIWLVLVNSFKTSGEAAIPTLALPMTWNIVENYLTVWTKGAYPRALLNNILVALPVIAAVVLAGSAAAWAFGRSKSGTMQVGYYVISMTILISPALIPTILLLQQLQLNGSMIGYILVMIGTRLGVVVFLATGFIRTLPTDLEDAALIDGASAFQTYYMIVLPLLAPILFTGSIILVISVWSDFFFASFLLQGRASETLSLSLYSFAATTAYSVNWSLVFTHVTMVSLPTFIAYAFMQKRILGGLTDGAIKG